MSLTSQLREAIDKSGLSLYAIAKATKTPYAAIHGFAHGQRGMTLAVANRLVELFGMKLTNPKCKVKRTKG
jgi:plasmid maintenance system antidote protein VapI